MPGAEDSSDNLPMEKHNRTSEDKVLGVNVRKSPPVIVFHNSSTQTPAHAVGQERNVNESAKPWGCKQAHKASSQWSTSPGIFSGHPLSFFIL